MCEEGFRHKQQQSLIQSWTKTLKNRTIQNSMFIVGLEHQRHQNDQCQIDTFLIVVSMILNHSIMYYVV